VALGRGTQQRDAADVDLLHELDAAQPLLRGLAEGVEVHGDEVDRDDALALELGAVLRVAPPREDARMDLRMERLDAATEQHSLTRDLFDRSRLDALALQERARAVRSDELPAELAQGVRERNEAAWIGDGEQGAHAFSPYVDHAERGNAPLA